MPELSIALDEGHRSRGERTLEHTILREGTWKHPKAPGGVLKIDSATLGELEKNFNAGVGLAKDAIPFHVGHTEHLDDRAAAWARVKVTDDPERPGKKRMVSLANYTTDEDYNKVKSGQYAYVSPTIDFGYTDKESGSRFGAVLRNVALTNYPYIKQMGPARVVNLSEIAHGNGDEETVRLAGGLGFDGTSAQGDPNPDGLPKGYDVQELPKQCLACARLGNDCPFAAPIAAADLDLKQAAAASGNCPQYVEADSNQPGGGGGADAQIASPAVGRSSTGRAQMSDGFDSVKLTDFGATLSPLHLHILSTVNAQRPFAGPRNKMGTASMLHGAIQAHTPGVEIAPHLATLTQQGLLHRIPAKTGAGTVSGGQDGPLNDVYGLTPQGENALKTHWGMNTDERVQMSEPNPDSLPSPLEYGVLGAMSDLGADASPVHESQIAKHDLIQNIVPGTSPSVAHVHGALMTLSQAGHVAPADKSHSSWRLTKTGRAWTSPTRAKMSDKPARGKHKPKGTTTMPLSEAQINKLMEQVNASRAEAHDAFLVSLAEDYHLPADTLKAVKQAFDDGASHSVALADAIGDATVALSEAESDVDLETPASTVDLSDAVLLPRATLRELIGAVASGGTGVKEIDTKPVPGKPRTKPVIKDGGANASDPALVALGEELAAMQPDEAVARMKEFEATGK